MNCPKCNKELMNINGKYVCVDCGIEVPETEAVKPQEPVQSSTASRQPVDSVGDKTELPQGPSKEPAGSLPDEPTIATMTSTSPPETEAVKDSPISTPSIPPTEVPVSSLEEQNIQVGSDENQAALPKEEPILETIMPDNESKQSQDEPTVNVDTTPAVPETALPIQEVPQIPVETTNQSTEKSINQLVESPVVPLGGPEPSVAATTEPESTIPEIDATSNLPKLPEQAINQAPVSPSESANISEAPPIDPFDAVEATPSVMPTQNPAPSPTPTTLPPTSGNGIVDTVLPPQSASAPSLDPSILQDPMYDESVGTNPPSSTGNMFGDTAVGQTGSASMEVIDDSGKLKIMLFVGIGLAILLLIGGIVAYVLLT